MDDQSFRKLVADMRHAQKEFVRTKSKGAWDAVKTAERKVDNELSAGEQDHKQKKLFGS